MGGDDGADGAPSAGAASVTSAGAGSRSAPAGTSDCTDRMCARRRAASISSTTTLPMATGIGARTTILPSALSS